MSRDINQWPLVETTNYLAHHTKLSFSHLLHLKGFTLPEVVMVMVILGILSAYVVMRFDNLDDSARTVAVKVLAGQIRVVADTAYNLSVAANLEDEASGIVQMRGDNAVRVIYGYPAPTTDGIVAALNSSAEDMDNIQTQAAVSTSDEIYFMRRDARDPYRCKVVYTFLNGQRQPNVTVDVSNCK